jgi:septum formation protein
MINIILASASPRRRELLAQIGWEFEVRISRSEEKSKDLPPGELSQALAREKAEDVFSVSPEPECLVIGADTIVALDDTVLGKPKDSEDAARMLRLLSGREHSVFTGVHLIIRGSEKVINISFYDETRVKFYPMSEEEITEYISGAEPFDKAGAYGIQGMGAKYIEEIHGDYNTVVGLPVGKIYQKVKCVIPDCV